MSVRASDDGQHLELRVRDTGIGISAEEQTRIFERFYQVPGARSRSREGTGIGLALVAELVRLHGGSVTVESQLGRGSTFIVRLPVGASAMPGVPGATSTSAGPAGGEVRRRAPELVLDSPALREDAPVTRTPALVPGGRILVADDDADMRRYVGNILGEQWAVETAQDGAAALRAVQANPPDLLVLDVMLPELDGFEVLAALRRDPATRRLPVILLSARAGAEAAAEGLLAGADDYVSKPFAAAELSARVRTHLEVARARAEAEAAVRARDDFVAVVTHDLKHPLAAANWHLEVLRRRANQVRSVTGEDLADLLDALQASIQALTAQIDELRDATRLRAGQPLALERAPTDLVALARRIVLQYQDPAERHQLHFESTAPSLHGVWDPMRLERVLANLLSNAMKYSPTGSDISVRLARDGARALLEVEDHGVGIPAGDLPHIFERYRRGSNVAEHTRGSGLGLPGARDIVEQHGGTLSVTSIEGKGATFVISLPLAEDVEP